MTTVTKTNGKRTKVSGKQSRLHGLHDRRLNMAIAKENWQEARRILAVQLEDDPDNHWLLARLSSILYEQRNYKEAMTCVLRAQELMPDCPLVQWDLAGTLLATGKVRRALAIYRRLLKSGPARLTKNPCSESKEWVFSLLVDCFFCVGLCYQELGKSDKARIAFSKFLQLRSVWCDGVYTLEDATERLKTLPSRNPSVELREATHSLAAFVK